MERLRVARAAWSALAVLLALGLLLVPASAAPAAEPRPPRSPDHGLSEASRDDNPRWAVTAAAALAAAGVALLGLGILVQRRGRRPSWNVQPPLLPSAGAVPPEAPERSARPRALGYVRLAPGAPSASFHAQAAAIETGCLARGITLVSLVSDLEPELDATERPPALAFAFERLESGDADRLVVSRLSHLAPTRAQLASLLESLAARRAGLVVLDRDLDIAALPDPALAAAVLSRHDELPAPRPPALAEGARPAVDAHIVSMLEEGASPEEVVAALNAEPVPPPQGRRWSPSGVQDALRRRGQVAGSKEAVDG